MSGWYAKALADVVAIAPDEAGDPVWHPLQHYFGLTAFGANVYVAPDAGGALRRESFRSSWDEHHLRDVPRLGDDADPADPSN
ncbi:MAG: hypothetical protein MSC30_02245 [Gaiellaceae bacterium MAG52_C11]|nr:hypothetical protein [Candidatus Gaiellasilicea maunaloa]